MTLKEVRAKTFPNVGRFITCTAMLAICQTPEILEPKWGIGLNTVSRTLNAKVYTFKSLVCAKAHSI
jgi:hypothetical protein